MTKSKRAPAEKAASARFRLQLLGPFRLESNGKHIALGRRGAQVLLSYLALSPGEHPREELAALLWGDSKDAQARASLRNILSVLRARLGPESIQTNRTTCRLNPDFAIEIDAHEFELALNTSPQTAIDLYHGELLADFDDEWVLPFRRHFHAGYVQALLDRTQELRAHSAYEAAVQTARLVLESEPDNERAYQHLMFCHLALGDRAATLNDYKDCVRALDERLDGQPARETTALYNWIRQAPADGAARTPRITNLPIPLSTFVGRTRELTHVKELVRQRRLVTLTGPGGSGKTRLAIQSATDLIDHFPDGVWWIELAALADAALVPQTIARVLGIHDAPAQSMAETLVARLASRQILLVLDNCEHLIVACSALVARLLAGCPGLKVIATSREPLNIPQELAWPVPSFALPEAASGSLAQLASSYESVRLLVDRARAVKPDFELTDANARAVMRICQQLDGIPLAIELAAARLNVLSPEQIVQRLDDRFSLLTAGSRTALPRQRTLRGLIDWSYDLLSEQERIAFERLSVFAGSFTSQAASAVCYGEGIAAEEVQPLVARLESKSLLSRREHNGEPRYAFLTTIRKYARDRLADSGEEGPTRTRHLAYFLDRAEQAAPGLWGAEVLDWVARLEVEHDDLRAALQFALTGEDVTFPLRLSRSLGRFWTNGGYWREGREVLTRVLERAGYGTDRESAEFQNLRAWTELAALSLMDLMGENTSQTQQRAEQLVSRFTEMGDKRGVAATLNRLGSLALGRGELTPAREFFEQCLALWRDLGDKYWIAYTLRPLGSTARLLGDYAMAQALYQESLDLRREIGDRSGIADALNCLGIVAQHTGDRVTATRLYRESLALYREIGPEYNIAGMLVNLGTLALNGGDLATAHSNYSESLSFMRQIGDRRNTAMLLDNLGNVARMQGDLAAAGPLLAESMQIRGELRDKRGLALTSTSLVMLQCAQGDYQAARSTCLEGLALAREAGAKETTATLLCSLGHIEEVLEARAAGRGAYLEALNLANELGVRLLSIRALVGIAHLLVIENAERATMLAAAAARQLKEIDGWLDPFDQSLYDSILASARTLSSAEAFSAAWAAGEMLTAEQVLSLACR